MALVVTSQECTAGVPSTRVVVMVVVSVVLLLVVIVH
jgi:hypothetical protein